MEIKGTEETGVKAVTPGLFTEIRLEKFSAQVTALGTKGRTDCGWVGEFSSGQGGSLAKIRG